MKIIIHIFIKKKKANKTPQMFSKFVIRMVTAAMKLNDAYSLEEKLWPT